MPKRDALTDELANIEICINDLERTLSRCDAGGYAMTAIHVDQAIASLKAYRDRLTEVVATCAGRTH